LARFGCDGKGQNTCFVLSTNVVLLLLYKKVTSSLLLENFTGQKQIAYTDELYGSCSLFLNIMIIK